MIEREYSYKEISDLSGHKESLLRTWFKNGWLVATSASGMLLRFTETAYNHARDLSIKNRPITKGNKSNFAKSPIFQRNMKIKEEKAKAPALAPNKKAVVFHKNGVSKAKKGA